jgi:hypothetical protein
MKKIFGLLIAIALVIGFATVAAADENAPIALTDAQMDQVVAGAFPGHQAFAAELKGDVATIMPAHVVGEQPGEAHQSLAANLKGDVADLMPGHVLD